MFAKTFPTGMTLTEMDVCGMKKMIRKGAQLGLIAAMLAMELQMMLAVTVVVVI
jgi:hypothetical protein